MQYVFTKVIWFYFWVAPLIIGLSCFYFFPILGWLTGTEHQPEHWMESDAALTAWALSMFALIGSGLFVSTRVRNKLVTLLYCILGLWSLSLIVLVCSLSGISPKT